jgi:predicted transcriptional regulator YheO
MSKIMDYYKGLVKFLGIALGENCEIALQDVGKENFCIVAIANSHISGRKVGSPLTDLALKFLESEIWKGKDYVCNYTGKTENNRVLNSSTYFIKENGKLLGMLCINIDNSKYIEMSNALLHLGGITIQSNYPEENKINAVSNNSNYNSEIENFYEKPDDVINTILNDFFNENNITADRLTQDEKISIIERLENRGIFRLKGAISYIADKLMISEASVYRYLSKLRKLEK